MSEIEALVSDNLDIWTGAVERKNGSGRGAGKAISLYGIQRLRELILNLAVRGKLVSQDLADEHVGELLNAVDEGKTKLAQNGLIRGTKTESVKADVEGPFSIPRSWRWVRLDRLGAIIGGGTPSAGDPTNFAEPGDGFPWITPADLSGFSAKHIGAGKRDLSKKGLESSSAKLMPAGTVLFTSRAPIGYVAIAANPIATNQGFKSVVPAVDGLSEFVALTLLSFAEEIEANAPGTTFKEVSGKIVSAIPIPLPPLAEQERIVAKVDELMALCDVLKRESEEALEAHQTLVETLLATLVNSTDAADLATNWARLEAHFDTLFTTEPSIEALKQTMLDLAVRGKLVDQRRADEPAALLLERIGNRGRGKTTRADKTDHAFECPSGWKWTNVQSLLSPSREISYGVIKLGPEPISGGIPTLRCSDVKPGYIDLSGVRSVNEAIEAEYSRTRLQGGEVVINIRGTLGGVALIPSEIESYNVAREVAVIPISENISGQFIVYLMLSPYFWNHIENNLRGIAYKGLNLSILRDLPIPLPPLAEQKRIVAKLDELMVLCEQAESRLAEAAQTQRHLADAITEMAAG